MTLTGEMLIGRAAIRGAGNEIHGVAAATGERLEPTFRGATPELVARACELAGAAFDAYREIAVEVRARFLEAIAENLQAVGEEIVARCMLESGLPRPRLAGELGRTTNQLRLFAAEIRDGRFLDVRIDTPLPDRKPAPRPDLRLRNIALGPVAVFGASNFPLAFSVAGGDTASALAAGCPVVAKAHNAHPAIKAVGFTGSRRGGLALVQIAQAREEPIPVYAEMSSINPVLLLPAALASRGAAIGQAFVSALTLGAGQFCTNPGLVLAVEGPGLDDFLAAAAEALAAAPAAPMLTRGICEAYNAGLAAFAEHPEVTRIADGQAGPASHGRAALFATSAEAFRRDRGLQAEVFGAAALVVRCQSPADLQALIDELEGQLTVAIHADEGDHALARQLMPALERKAGRIVFNGFGTGVEVGHAMVHGGPFPATSDNRWTSVGSLAIRRFLRPVSYQDVPEALLPSELHVSADLPRLLDGALQLRGR